MPRLYIRFQRSILVGFFLVVRALQLKVTSFVSDRFKTANPLYQIDEYQLSYPPKSFSEITPFAANT